MMKIRAMLCTAALALSVLAAPAGAQDFTHGISERLGDLMPYNGAYIDWNVGGVGMDWDSGPAGSGYGGIFTFHAYDADGNQVNWTGQPAYVPATNADRIATGVIGRASADLYLATDGPCIGCAPATPVITPVGIHAKLAWTTPRTVTLTLSGAHTGTYHLTAVNYASTDDRGLLEGTWAATYVADLNHGYNARPVLVGSMAILEMRAIPAPTVVRDPNAPAGTPLPPEGAQFYAVGCMPDDNHAGSSDRAPCRGFYNRAGYWADPRTGSYLLAWYDPATGRAGLEAAMLEAGTYVVGAAYGTGNATMHYDLYVAQNLIHGRGIVYYDGNGYRGAPSSLVMARLPDDTRRSSYDYPQD